MKGKPPLTPHFIGKLGVCRGITTCLMFDPKHRSPRQSLTVSDKEEINIMKTCPCNKQRFLAVKIEIIFSAEIFYIFLIFAQNIDCGYTLEPHRRGGSNEYPQSMFWSKIKKNRYTPAYPNFAFLKSGIHGGIHYTDMFS